MECTVRGVPVHYEEYGTGRPLLMLHGWPGFHGFMTHHLEPLFAQRPGWRRLYPDLPGMGETPGADWITSQDQMLEVALGFIDALAPGERFTLAGASYGGYLGRGVIRARRAQMDGAMLWTPLVELDPARRDLPPHQVFQRDPDLLATLAPDETLWTQVSVVQTPAMLAEFRAAVKPGFQAADHDFLGRVRKNYAFSFDVDALPEPFPAPALILAGRQDAMCGYREAWKLVDNLPRGTFAVLDRAGHGLAGEQRTLFRALVGEWLDRVEEYIAQRA